MSTVPLERELVEENPGFSNELGVDPTVVDFSVSSGLEMPFNSLLERCNFSSGVNPDKV